MEPGGGKYAVGKWPDGVKSDAHSIVMQKPEAAADLFSQRYMIAKCVAMVRAFRSHPSLIQYTLQNEIGADFADPATIAILDIMRREDESRIVALNDGLIDPPTRAAQAWYEPYGDRLHRSDQEEWGGWWDRHQGAGDQWYDDFYKGPEDFVDYQPLRAALVQFGEMEGCATPDNHVLALADIQQRGGASYDLQDHREQLDAYNAFLDRWGFRTAFPNTEKLFHSIGRKSYDAWQQYMENIRINDAADFAVISGWESTAIENHSGLVDNLRNFKSDPAIIRSSLLPVRPVAKQHALAVARGDRAVFDLWLLNDTAKPVQGEMVFSMRDPAGGTSVIARYPAPVFDQDSFSALVARSVGSPVLTQEGLHRFRFQCPGAPAHLRDILVVDGQRRPLPGKTLRVGIAGTLAGLQTQLGALAGIAIEPYRDGERYDVIVAGGLTEKSTAAQRLGGDAGVQMQRDSGSPLVPGEAPAAVLELVRAGTPLLVVAQEDGLADGLAAQLAERGAFNYRGQVGRSRAPWMGSWCFVRSHPVYAGLPVDQAMGIHYQARGRQANGLLVDGQGVEVFAGYGRDHDRQIGAATFTARLGRGKILFQRVPDLNGPMQLRFLSNALAWLCA
jgi:beta-galactosidase